MLGVLLTEIKLYGASIRLLVHGGIFLYLVDFTSSGLSLVYPGKSTVPGVPLPYQSKIIFLRFMTTQLRLRFQEYNCIHDMRR
jgi:hypothetical protein